MHGCVRVAIFNCHSVSNCTAPIQFDKRFSVDVPQVHVDTSSFLFVISRPQGSPSPKGPLTFFLQRVFHLIKPNRRAVAPAALPVQRVDSMSVQPVD